MFGLRDHSISFEIHINTYMYQGGGYDLGKGRTSDLCLLGQRQAVAAAECFAGLEQAESAGAVRARLE